MIHTDILTWVREEWSTIANETEAIKRIKKKFANDLHQQRIAFTLWSTSPNNHLAVLVGLHQWERSEEELTQGK